MPPGPDHEEQPLTLADVDRAPTAFGCMARRRAVPGASSLTLRTTLLAANSVLGSTLGIAEHLIGAATSTEYKNMFSVNGRRMHGFVIDPGAATNLCGTDTLLSHALEI